MLSVLVEEKAPPFDPSSLEVVPELLHVDLRESNIPGTKRESEGVINIPTQILDRSQLRDE